MPGGMFGAKPRKSFFDEMLPPAALPQDTSLPQVAPMPQAPKLGFLDKLGLVGDVFTGDPVTQQRLMQQQVMQQKQMARYEPQEVGGSIVRLNPQSGQYETLFSAPQKERAPYRWEANDGSLMEIGEDGAPRAVYKDPTPKVQMIAVDNGDGTKTLMPFANGVPLGQGGAAPSGAVPALPEGYKVRPRGGAGSGPATFQPSSVMDSLIEQESSGRPGVLGPKTRYGQAQGLTQMLPATAEAVAKKLGVPWRPDLMTGTSKAAAEYQRALGQAYLEEGYGATGNIRDALHYYHGGPNRRLWGPKTRGYADKVISRLGSN
jgi:hypothetical protein